jgi:OOP family OmpA-OmpF porin
MDKCPDSPADKPVDAEGCTIVSVVLKNVQFESNSSELTAGSSEALDKAVASMNQYDHLRIEIQAHTDNTGDAVYNQSLSQKRAESVRDYMVDKGIAADRMEVKGYGESKPIADNNTREGRAANRRVELKIID